MKKVFIFLAVALLAFTLAGCGESKTGNDLSTGFSTEYDYCYLSLPDGSTVEGHIDTYCMMQYGLVVVRIDGVTYRTHASRVVLVAGK